MKRSITSVCLLFCLNTSFCQLHPLDTVNQIDVYFETSNDILSQTDNDVIFDIGPKAWRIEGGFSKGQVRRFTIATDSVIRESGKNYTVSASLGPTPLLVKDIKLLRIEKKGISLCDILQFIPNDVKNAPGTKKLFEKCEDIGGLSNAPDSKYDFINPDDASPEGAFRQLKKSLGIAEGINTEALEVMQKALQAYNQAVIQYDRYVALVDNLQHRVDQIPKAAMQKYDDVQGRISSLTKTLNAIPAKIAATGAGCHYENQKVRAAKAILSGGASELTKVLVCPLILNQKWKDLNDQLIDLTSEKSKLAVEAQVDLIKQLGDAQIELTKFRVERATADVNFSAATKMLTKSQEELIDLEHDSAQIEHYVDNVLSKIPFPDFSKLPGVNQWKLKSFAVYVNNKYFYSTTVNHRFKQYESSWQVFIGNQSPEYQLLNSLRIDQPGGGNQQDAIVAALSSPFFKNEEISGWDGFRPVQYATVIGTLVNNPNSGWDGFISLDIRIDTLIVGNIRFILDGKHGIGHNRYIRCEYRRVKPSGAIDDTYNNNAFLGRKFRISGPVFRDLDRLTFYELHPERTSEVEVIR